MLVKEATAYADAARAPATLRAYEGDWTDFAAFAQAHGFEALPADPAVVALYLTEGADRLKPATLTRRAAAISVRHDAAGFPSPTQDPRVRAILRGIRRTHGTAPAQATPAGIGEVRRMVAHLPATTAGTRDAAVLLLGFAGAFRRSELVALNWGDLSSRDEGLEVTIRRSKTDPEGRGRRVAIPFGTDTTTCPVRAVNRWREKLSDGNDGLLRGPVFRGVSRYDSVGPSRLSAAAVNLIIKRAATRAGLDATQYSGHSLRAGFATTAALNGASERQIANQTGHRSLETLRGYIRPARLFTDNAVSVLGL